MMTPASLKSLISSFSASAKRIFELRNKFNISDRFFAGFKFLADSPLFGRRTFMGPSINMFSGRVMPLGSFRQQAVASMGWAVLGLSSAAITAMHRAAERKRERYRVSAEILPSYQTWSKSSGMPPNHLSTDGLAIALSNNRHTSII